MKARSGRLLLGLAAAAVGAFALVLSATFLGIGNGSSCACAYEAYFDAPGLVEASEVIVVASFEERRTVTGTTTNPVSDVKIEHREEVHSYRVLESIKGPVQAGEMVEVFGGPDGIEHHVLFLVKLAFVGVDAWTWPGEPRYASLDGDRLVFKAGLNDYREEVSRRGKPGSDSEASFVLTLPELRRLAAVEP